MPTATIIPFKRPETKPKKHTDVLEVLTGSKEKADELRINLSPAGRIVVYELNEMLNPDLYT